MRAAAIDNFVVFNFVKEINIAKPKNQVIRSEHETTMLPRKTVFCIFFK